MTNPPLSILIPAFTNCIVHIINYLGSETQQSQQVIPWILSKYNVNIINLQSAGFTYREPVDASTNSTEFFYIFQKFTCVRSCFCDVHVYIDPPMSTKSEFVDEDGKLVIPWQYLKPVKYPSALYNHMSLTYIRPSYQILLIEKTVKETPWAFAQSEISKWYFNLIRLVIVRTENNDIMSVSIGARWFDRKVKTRLFFVVPISNKSFSLNVLEIEFKRINFRFSNFWKVIKQDAWITTNDQSKTTNLEVTLLSILVSNLTFILPDQIHKCSGKERLSRECDPYLIAPTINLEATRSLSFIRHRDEFTFLACGKSNLSHMSFWGFVTAFDTTTWVLIFVSFYASRLVVDSYCAMKYNSSHSKFSCVNFFKVLLSGMNLLIEQNDNLWLNRSQVSCVYWISCALLLSGIIFSNLYRGSNISAISAPLKGKPLKSTDEL